MPPRPKFVVPGSRTSRISSVPSGLRSYWPLLAILFGITFAVYTYEASTRQLDQVTRQEKQILEIVQRLVAHENVSQVSRNDPVPT